MSDSTQNSKKRKRPANEAPAAEESLKFRVKKAEDGEIGPVVVGFPNGPPYQTVLNNGNDGLHFTLWKSETTVEQPKSAKSGGNGLFSRLDKEAGKTARTIERLELRASAPNFNVEYAGRDFGPNSFSSKSEQYVIGVYNKDKRQITLVPAHKMFHMEHTIKGLEVPTEEIYEEDAKFAGLTPAQRRRAAQAEIGNRRTKSIVKNMIMNNLTNKNTVAVDLDKYQLREEVLDQEEAQPTSLVDLPPFNASTKRVDDIYDKDAVINPDHLHLLNKCPFVKAVQDIKELGRVEAELANHPFESDTLKRLHGFSSVDERVAKAKILQYLHYYVLFFKQAADNRATIKLPSDTLKRIPHTILNAIVEEFSEGIPGKPTNIRKMGTVAKHKMINYICILALMSKNYITEFTKLAPELGMTTKEMRPHFLYVGCRVFFGRPGDDLSWAKQDRDGDVDMDEVDDDDDAEDEDGKKKRKSGAEEKKGARIYIAKLYAPLVLPKVKKPVRAAKSDK